MHTSKPMKPMKKHQTIIILIAVALFFACKKQAIIIDPTPIIVVEEPLITLPTSWEKNETLSLGMPTSAAVFELKTIAAAVPFRAIAFVFNANDTNIVVSTALNTARPTPTKWASTESKLLAIINAGFFDLTNGQSYSLVVNDSKMLSANVKALTRSYNGTATSYFPTRAALGITGNSLSANWIYNVKNAENYAYLQPSQNALNTAPQPKPSEIGGTLWTPKVAIGGSPMLLKDGNINITDVAEMIDVNNTSGRSRSAMGYTAKGRVILLVIEKNTTKGTVGATLVDTAQILKDMGCVNAINLDGGGSTCLLVNGGLDTNTPEANAQRGVTSVIMVKKK
jgi:exopolysaccharide biosynthesis protein